MLGSEYINTFSRRSSTAWEQAALDLAREGSLTPWPFVDVTLTDGADTLVLSVQSDVLAIGSLEDHVRLPLTTRYAQSIANLNGSLLPTPWIEYAIWRSATVKLDPIAMVPNQYANLEQYAAHSRIVDEQLGARGVAPGSVLVSGQNKGVVVANFYKPGKVLLFGWYRAHLTDPKTGRLTDQPAPDVFDDGKLMGAVNRQPIQPKSNVHDEGYVDYSQVCRLIAPICTVNGQQMETVQVYQHPTLYKLVNPDAANPPSQRGPIRTPRYPAPVPPAAVRPAFMTALGPAAVRAFLRQGRVPFTPDPTELALDEIARRRFGRE